MPARAGGVLVGPAAAAAAAARAPGGVARGRVAVAPLRDKTKLTLPHAQALLLPRPHLAGQVSGRILYRGNGTFDVCRGTQTDVDSKKGGIHEVPYIGANC